MSVVILTGPPGAGKNTIVNIVARRSIKCAVIDADLVRWMILQPHKAPWEGEEGRKQQVLGARNAGMLTRNFVREGYDVLILDVLSKETATIYKKELREHKVKIVLLFPTYEEIVRRNTVRPPRLKDTEVKMLYGHQSRFVHYDEKIDNTNLSAEEVADKLISDLL